MNGTMWIVLAVVVVIVLILVGVALARRSKDQGAHSQRMPASDRTPASDRSSAGSGEPARRKADSEGKAGTGKAAASTAGAAGVAGAAGRDDRSSDAAADTEDRSAKDGPLGQDRSSDEPSRDGTDALTQDARGGPDKADAPTTDDSGRDAAGRTGTMPTLDEDSDREYFGDHDDVRAPDGSDDATARKASHADSQDPSEAATDVIPVGPRDDHEPTSTPSVPHAETGQASSERARSGGNPVVDDSRRAPGQVAPVTAQEPAGQQSREPASTQDPVTDVGTTGTAGTAAPRHDAERLESADADEWAAPQPTTDSDGASPVGRHAASGTPTADTSSSAASGQTPNPTGGSTAGSNAAGGSTTGGGAAGAGHKIQDLRHRVQDGAKERWNRPGQDGQTPGDKFGHLREKVEGEVRTRMQNRSGGGQGTSSGQSSAGLRDRVEDGIRRFRDRGGNSSSGQ